MKDPSLAIDKAIEYADEHWEDYTLETTAWQDGDFRVTAYESFHRNGETYRRRLVITPHQTKLQLVRHVSASEATVIETEEL